MQINLIDNAESPPIEHHQNMLLKDIETIPPNICTSLVLNHTLNYLTQEQILSLLHKIRHNGVIAISSLDAMETAKAMYLGTIDASKLSELTSNHVSQHSLIDIQTMLTQHGYHIQLANIDNLAFFIKAQRP